MNKDILGEITKYLKPKEEYYLFLEISEDPTRNIYVYQFYLIHEINNENRMKSKIETIHVQGKDIHRACNFVFGDFNQDGCRIVHMRWFNSEGDYRRSVLLRYPCSDRGTLIYISKKNKELNLVQNWNLPYDYVIPNMNYLNSFMYQPDDEHNYPYLYIHKYKINRRSIASIQKALEVFQRVGKILDINDINLTEKEKKYVKILIKKKK